MIAVGTRLFPLVAAAVVAGCLGWALQPVRAATSEFWLGTAAPYVALALLGWALWRSAGGTLPEKLRWREVVRYRRGDASFSAPIGLVLVGAAWVLLHWFTEPGSLPRAWVFRLALVASGIRGVVPVLLLFLTAACEEVVWRGCAQSLLASRFGPRKGWLLSSVLYAAAHFPAAQATADPELGLNPVLPVSALVLGLVTGALVRWTGRLAPAVVTHFVFTYFGITWLLQ